MVQAFELLRRCRWLVCGWKWRMVRSDARRGSRRQGTQTWEVGRLARTGVVGQSEDAVVEGEGRDAEGAGGGGGGGGQGVFHQGVDGDGLA